MNESNEAGNLARQLAALSTRSIDDLAVQLEAVTGYPVSRRNKTSL